MDKFTYQNWLNGNIELEDLAEIIVSQGNDYKPGQLYNDFLKITGEQKFALLKRIKDLFEARKRIFKEEYDYTLVKRDYLHNTINSVESLLQKIRSNKKDIYESALHVDESWRKLTSKQVKEYLSYNISEHKVSEFILDYLKATHIIDPIERNIVPLTYIVNDNFLQWLYWFREQQTLDRSEPTIPNLGRSVEVDAISIAKKVLNNKKVSYIWLNDPEKELVELYELTSDTLIQGSASLEQFKAVFTGQPLNTILPLRWHNDNASELLYFILQLEKTDNIQRTGRRTDYKILTACFVKSDGKPFTAAFSSLKQQVSDTLSAERKQTVDNIVKNFT